MVAISFETARTIGVIVIGVFVVGAIAAGILMKTIAQKLAMVSIFGLLALLAWSQRSSLEDCAQVIRDHQIAGEATCRFFGRDVSVTTRAGS